MNLRENTGGLKTYRLYGLTLNSNYAFRSYIQRGDGRPDLWFRYSHQRPANWPDVSDPIYSSRQQTENAISALRIYGAEGRIFLLRFAGIADFRVCRDEIVCYSPRSDVDESMEVCLLGLVIAFWIERNGWPVLHSSSVILKNRAAVFLAGGGSGKTSLALSFLKTGCSLLTDDLLPVEITEGGVIGKPGFGQVRLWPAEARYFLGNTKNLDKIHPFSPKLRARVDPEHGVGRFSPLSKPIASIYLLERRPPGRDFMPIKITPVSPGTAVLELIGATYLGDVVEALGTASARLRQMGKIAETVPIKRISYPSGLELLGRVRDIISEDLETSAGSS